MHVSEKLKFSKFKVDDFEEYRSWYEDAELNMHLGPMDQEWLDCVLTETDGCEYSVFRGDEIVAIVGIDFPGTEHPEYCITDLAIKPSLKNQGIGSKVLSKLMQLYSLKRGESWKAFINVNNPKAKSFFEKNGWVCLSESPNEHGMLALSFTALP